MNFLFYPVFNMDSNLETKTFPGLRRKPERIILGSGKNDFFSYFFYNMTLYVCNNIIGRLDPLPWVNKITPKQSRLKPLDFLL